MRIYKLKKMNRTMYFPYIRNKLVALATEIELGGKLNVLDLHAHSESFYLHLLNELFNWKLENINKIKHNVEAIDLISHSPEKIVIQVSATCTKNKIESALGKNIIKDHSTYCFKFVSISKDASKLRENKYLNPHGIVFDPVVDIYDINSLLSCVLSLKVEHQKKIYELIKSELGSEIDSERLDSNLSAIINLLSEENLDEIDKTSTVDSFEIDRKIAFNNLDTAKLIINDYNIYHSKLDKIYSEFDTFGVNKSSTVLATIRREYAKNLNIKKDDELFYLILDNIQEKIIKSTNFIKIPLDLLEVCVNILVVDAFIRCKIFENPKNYKYVTS